MRFEMDILIAVNKVKGKRLFFLWVYAYFN
jgi:hypothetical protein